VLPARPDDTFGTGWSRIQFSDNLVPLLRDALGPSLGRDDTAALYYNVAAARWLGLMVDLEAVNPGAQEDTDVGELKDVNTAIVGGLRGFVGY
jgi:porin